MLSVAKSLHYLTYINILIPVTLEIKGNEIGHVLECCANKRPCPLITRGKVTYTEIPRSRKPSDEVVCDIRDIAPRLGMLRAGSKNRKPSAVRPQVGLPTKRSMELLCCCCGQQAPVGDRVHLTVDVYLPV